ncbi:E3 ubiquitin-protein ligase RNF14-like isoform X1 [Osmia lignaria lignaria]|uniref:E3 ubiquitin-protein ligase RNF14-like isoform X1 n=1 Tax=Osmia lignaria lignaria TaxID=1437193 RepID=UPI0014781B53|nr:E3 ubiquitin-protein ligase RNF14-like isoform X1 [Osmia lignaria]
MNNRDRQENEILALSCIYNQNEFSYIKDDDMIQIYFNVYPATNNKVLMLKNLRKMYLKCLIKYLPPVRIYVQLPMDYPTKNSPNFYITSSWLTPWQISFICQQLDEIWSSNKEQEVLFLWFEFLRHDLLNFLQINETLDISLLFLRYYNLTDYFKLNVTFSYDVRAICNVLVLNPIKLFMDYNEYQMQFNFERSYYSCVVCFEVYSGKKCIQLQSCGHTFCRNCMQEYLGAKINENMVKDIMCPDSNCKFNIMHNEIKKLCPNLFSKYENLLLQITLNSMKDIVYCPRISCQCPVVNDNDNIWITCSKCDHAFCRDCRKAYHGNIPCTTISSSELVNLMENYEKGNIRQKQLLLKKYGQRQIQEVEKHLSKKYIKENTKSCPNCQAPISKIDGCNKITCTYCNAHFCWLCGQHLNGKQPYFHFTTDFTSPCFHKLFDYNFHEDM